MIGFLKAGVAQLSDRRKSRRRNPRFNNKYLPIPRSLTQPKRLPGPMNRLASVAFSLTLRTTSLRKTLRSPVQDLHGTLAAAGLRPGPLQPPAPPLQAKIRATPFGP